MWTKKLQLGHENQNGPLHTHGSIQPFLHKFPETLKKGHILFEQLLAQNSLDITM